MSKLLNRAWWTAALERAGSQAAEAVLGFLTAAGVIMATGINWAALVGFALGGALASLLLSLASLPELDNANRSPARARLLRLVRTALAAFAGALLTWFGDAAVNVFEFDWTTALNAVAVTVLLAVVKVFIRKPAEAV